jgi:hypothetical protein
MTDRERFTAVVRGQPVDYVPIFGFIGAPGVSAGCAAQRSALRDGELLDVPDWGDAPGAGWGKGG